MHLVWFYWLNYILNNIFKVYQMIYEMLSLNQQMGHAYAPTEIRPILLHYDDNVCWGK